MVTFYSWKWHVSVALFSPVWSATLHSAALNESVFSSKHSSFKWHHQPTLTLSACPDKTFHHHHLLGLSSIN